MFRSIPLAALALLAGCASGQSNSDSRSGNEIRVAAQTAQQPQRKGTSDRCYTPAANCVLSERKAIGASCWCVTPFGPSYGEVR